MRATRVSDGLELIISEFLDIDSLYLCIALDCYRLQRQSRPLLSYMTQTKPIFRAVGLGGMGHVGGNLFVYETPEDLIAVDCGVLFADEGFPGIDKLIPDIGYLLENQHKFRGYAITHGHEDHIGALPHVITKLPGPIYGTKFLKPRES